MDGKLKEKADLDRELAEKRQEKADLDEQLLKQKNLLQVS